MRGIDVPIALGRRLGQKTIAATAAGVLGLLAGGSAGQGVHFDPNPAAPLVRTFDWHNGHVLFSNCFGQGAVGSVGGCTIYAQGRISAISDPANAILSLPPGISFTYTLVTKATMSLPGGSLYDGFTPRFETILFSDAADPTAKFAIYTNTPDNTNPLAGTGYDDGVQILQGTVKVRTFALVNFSVSTAAWDQAGPDNYPGTMTRPTMAAPSFEINVVSKDNRYFTDPLTMFTVTFNPDALHTGNLRAPFSYASPAAKVAGKAFNPATDAGLDKVVDIYCGTKMVSATCSAEFESDAMTLFLTIP